MYGAMDIERGDQSQRMSAQCANLAVTDDTPLLRARSDPEKGELRYSDRLGGGGAGLLLYGSLGSPLQSVDIELSAACVNDAVLFRYRTIPCPIKCLRLNSFRDSLLWSIVYAMAVVLFLFRCMRFELLKVVSEPVLFFADCISIVVMLSDLLLKGYIYGMGSSVTADLIVLGLCAADSVYIFLWDQFSFFTVIRIYFIITFSEGTLNSCRNSVWCMQKVITAMSVQALSWFFFSSLCVVLFGTDDASFNDLPHALVNMFALITTSNNPDVWVKLYSLNKMNNYVAVTIFSEFLTLTNASLHVRRQHRQESLQMAFRILDTRGRNAVDPSAIYALLRFMRPHYRKDKISVLYECMDPSNEFRPLNFDKFSRIIDALSIRVSTVYRPNSTRWAQTLLTSASPIYQSVLCLVPLLNMTFVAAVCMAGKRDMIELLARPTLFAAFGLTLFSFLFLLLDMMIHGIKTCVKYAWVFVTLSELIVSSVGVAWTVYLYSRSPPFPSMLSRTEVSAYMLSTGLDKALILTMCGRCLAVLHTVRVLPHFRKIVYSSYAVIPGLLPMIVPLFSVAHVFAFIGMYFFAGLLNAEVDFGDGKGHDPYYGLLDFSSYTNSLIIIVNLLVVNNWVKMGLGLCNATGSLWVYAYFISFFVIGVTFCLLSLTSIFISSIMMNHNTNPVVKNVAVSGPTSPTIENGASMVSRQRLPGYSPSPDFKVSLRHQDADKLFRIIDSVSAPDFLSIMELTSSLMGGCIVVLSDRTKILFESPATTTLVNRYLEGGINRLYDDMVLDSTTSNRRSKVQKKETRVSEVLADDCSVQHGAKVANLLSGPILLGAMKYKQTSSNVHSISGVDSEKVNRMLQVRYCCKYTSTTSTVDRLQDSTCGQLMAVFIMKESSQRAAAIAAAIRLRDTRRK